VVPRRGDERLGGEIRASDKQSPCCAQSEPHFVWPLGKSPMPDEMNTSYGPRIDADRWDFHDGIDLPAPVGTAVHAMADGKVHRAGPADKAGPGRGFGSTHIVLKVRDPVDGKNDLFLVCLHLDSTAGGVIPGAQVAPAWEIRRRRHKSPQGGHRLRPALGASDRPHLV